MFWKLNSWRKKIIIITIIIKEIKKSKQKKKAAVLSLDSERDSVNNNITLSVDAESNISENNEIGTMFTKKIKIIGTGDFNRLLKSLPKFSFFHLSKFAADMMMHV